MLADGVVQKGRDDKYSLTPMNGVNSVNAMNSGLKVVAVGGVLVDRGTGGDEPCATAKEVIE